LLKILTEWNSPLSYANRVTHLRTGGGANDPLLLTPTTVQDDGVKDILTGGVGSDLFIVSATVTATDAFDLKGGETLFTV
jgi:hypothetical protein